MQQSPFDPARAARRHERALRLGGDPFLHHRAADDILDRLADQPRARRALVIGAPPAVAERFADVAEQVADLDPSHLDAPPFAPASFDLAILFGALDIAPSPAAAAFALRHLLEPGGRLHGALVGGASLPRLRHALLTAESATGRIVQRLHPLVDGPSLAALLTAAGFEQAVVAVDRVQAGYPSLDRLVGDLRAMGCTAVLAGPRPPLTRAIVGAARAAFLGDEARATERFHLLLYSASAPPE